MTGDLTFMNTNLKKFIAQYVDLSDGELEDRDKIIQQNQKLLPLNRRIAEP